jgi:FlaA1/EpsC-like NDP-sugar epimerase
MLNQIINLSRSYKRLILVFIDSILLIFVLWASYSIRLDLWYYPKDDTLRLILAAPIIGIPIFSKLGLYKSVIRHIDFKSLWHILVAVTIYALLWGLLSFFAQGDFAGKRGFIIEIFPRSVIIINWLLSILVIIGIRVVARFILSEHVKFSFFNNKSKINLDNLDDGKSKVLIYGAGSAGVQLASALSTSSELVPVGFIDDNKDLEGNNISGLNVHSVNNIEDLINKLNVDEV